MNQEKLKKEIRDFLNENPYSRVIALERELTRARHIFKVAIEKKKELILDGEDFKIIDRFMSDFKISEGSGFSMYFGLMLNYYKHMKEDNK